MLKENLNNNIYSSVKTLLVEARKKVYSSINSTMVNTYWNIGRIIVEEEQNGKNKAEYGEYLIKYLSRKLTEDFGKGFSKSNLEYMRLFYLIYKNQGITIAQTLSGQLDKNKSISQTVSGKLGKDRSILQTLSTKSRCPVFSLSWSHYVFLIRMDEAERKFYEIEAANQGWSVRELERQYNSSLYERLSLSRNKKQIKELSNKGLVVQKPQEAIKEPYVLEFLGLKEDSSYSEHELETAIINKIEHFMLELGKGFLFAGRQVRFSFNEEHYYIDLVFYNRLLKCFVLIDLKIGKLKHQDIGQMQMYVNYYDRKIRTMDENKTIGIILCKEANKSVVEFTLPKSNKSIFAKQYKLYLPSKSDLQKQLEE
jgi:predicted nuclease of restriction endonuclease-like (RecB) superfamily